MKEREILLRVIDGHLVSARVIRIEKGQFKGIFYATTMDLNSAVGGKLFMDMITADAKKTKVKK